MQVPITQILRDPRLGLDKELSSIAESQIQLYLDLLVKWNHKINLTAEKDPDQILKRHVFDSLQYAREITQYLRVMDIGSGAGFPGIPLKIICPKIILALVDSQRKRCSFMETVVRELGFKQTEVINARAEDISVPKEDLFNLVIFRAVSDLMGCLSLGVRFIVPGGRLIVKKPPNENPIRQASSLTLIGDTAITSYQGVVSSLLVYEKCFT